MIKPNFKSIIPVAASLMIGAALLAPAAFAQTYGTSTPAVTPKIVAPVAPRAASCTLYSDKAAKVSQNSADNQAKLDQKRADQLSKINGNRANNDKKLADNRLSADQKRAQAIAKLLGKNLTDAQKAALTAFQTAVAQAVTTRQAAVDAAIAAYRSGLDTALAGRTTSVNQATTDYKNAVQAAYAKAYSDCTAKVDKKTVKANLNAALKAARQAYTANRQSIAKLQSNLTPLAKTRQKAIAAAEAAFKTAVNNAKTTLMAAFPPKTKPVTGSTK